MIVRDGTITLMGAGALWLWIDDEETPEIDDGPTRENGTKNDDIIRTGGGNDTVFGEEGNDLILAGADDDRAFGGSGGDFVFGEDGNDFLRGGRNSDTIFGGAGSDTLCGDVGNDVIVGADVIQTQDLIGTLLSGPLPEDANVIDFNDLDADTGELDILDGGFGNDTIIAGSNDLVITGPDADEDVVNVGQWVDPNKPVIITQFDAAKDVMVYTFEGTETPVLEFGETNGQAALLVDGKATALFENTTLSELRQNNTRIIIDRIV